MPSRGGRPRISRPADADVSAGSLFVINRQFDCPEGYVGLGLEQIGAAVDVDTSTPTPEDASPTDGGSASGPGFGVAGALAGVGGLAGLAKYLKNGRGE